MAKKPESDKDTKESKKKSSGGGTARKPTSSAKKGASRSKTSSSAGKGRTGAKKTAPGGSTKGTSRSTSGASKAAGGPDEMPRTASEAVDQAVGRPISDKIWRLIAMVAFALIAYFGFIALVVLAAMQYIVVLVADKPNQELRKFMGRLIAYLKDIYDYLSYARDEMPFPFSAFPEEDD